jgi:hypothetical protein
MSAQASRLEEQQVNRTGFSAIWTRVAALVATALLSLLAFAYLFTTFVPWDDEGYFLIAFRDYLSGRKLYDQVFAMYGPFTFWTAAAVARFAPGNVTHDAFRWLSLFLWIAIAAIMAATVWRWTRRSSLSFVVFLLVGSHLKGLAKGVGHPQIWIILAAALLLYVGLDWVSVPGKQWRAFLTGSLVAIIVLCKINLGSFAFLGIALALSFQLRGLLRTLGVAIFGLAAASFGVLIFLRAAIAGEKYFALAYLFALASVVAVAVLQPVDAMSIIDDRPLALRSFFYFLASLAACACVGIVLTLASGTTAHGLFHALITEPSKFINSYHHPFSDPERKGSILLSIVGVAVAAAVIRMRLTLQARPVWLGGLKVTVGVALLCAFCYGHRPTLAGSLLFLLLLLIDAPPMTGGAYSNRILLASMSLLFTLQLFPMAGEQADWATLLPMVAAAVILADGLDCLERGSSAVQLPQWSLPLARSTALILAIYLFLSVGIDAVTRFRRWQTAQSLDLPGAHWLRLPPDETARLRDTVSLLNQNCKTVLVIPGLYSFSVWSGVPPIEDKRFNTWPFLWPDEVEKNELPKLRRSDRGCVLTSEKTYRFFENLAVKPGNDELLSNVRQTMTPIGTVQDFTLYRASPDKH